MTGWALSKRGERDRGGGRLGGEYEAGLPVPGPPRSESVLTVSWTDDYGRLNAIVVVLGVLAAVFHWLPPWGVL